MRSDCIVNCDYRCVCVCLCVYRIQYVNNKLKTHATDLESGTGDNSNNNNNTVNIIARFVFAFLNTHSRQVQLHTAHDGERGKQTATNKSEYLKICNLCGEQRQLWHALHRNIIRIYQCDQFFVSHCIFE